MTTEKPITDMHGLESTRRAWLAYDAAVAREQLAWIAHMRTGGMQSRVDFEIQRQITARARGEFLGELTMHYHETRMAAQEAGWLDELRAQTAGGER